VGYSSNYSKVYGRISIGIARRLMKRAVHHGVDPQAYNIRMCKGIVNEYKGQFFTGNYKHIKENEEIENARRVLIQSQQGYKPDPLTPIKELLHSFTEQAETPCNTRIFFLRQKMKTPLKNTAHFEIYIEIYLLDGTRHSNRKGRY
jgi:hypothetical protein